MVAVFEKSRTVRREIDQQLQCQEASPQPLHHHLALAVLLLMQVMHKVDLQVLWQPLSVNAKRRSAVVVSKRSF